MFKKKNNKWAIGLTDLAVWVIVINVIWLIFVSTITFSTMNLNRWEERTYINILLTDCAEAVQWIRYWEYDSSWNSSWDNLKFNYQTWMYKLSFDDMNNFRELNPIYSDIPNQIIYPNIHSIFTTWTWHNAFNQWEMINFDPIDPRNTAERYVYLNTTWWDSIWLTCYVRYKFRSKAKLNPTDSKSINQYDQLKTIFYNYY